MDTRASSFDSDNITPSTDRDQDANGTMSFSPKRAEVAEGSMRAFYLPFWCCSGTLEADTERIASSCRGPTKQTNPTRGKSME